MVYTGFAMIAWVSLVAGVVLLGLGILLLVRFRGIVALALGVAGVLAGAYLLFLAASHFFAAFWPLLAWR